MERATTMASLADDTDLLQRATAMVKSVGESIGSSESTLQWSGREPKAPVDRRLHQELIDRLAETGIPILSEESEDRIDWRSGAATWIVDPLDGTLNYVRRVGPSAISVCLWRGDQPAFGIVMDLTTRDLACGGRAHGAWTSTGTLSVSNTDSLQQAVLCTGIPALFDFQDRDNVDRWTRVLAQFGKIRMIGSAASSLLLVARGAADCYSERDVRIWDVAAGMALVQGAGGVCRVLPGTTPESVHIVASNAALAMELSMLSDT
jgi:myo-inositol-1(or 4)-monophosphatase